MENVLYFLYKNVSFLWDGRKNRRFYVSLRIITYATMTNDQNNNARPMTGDSRIVLYQPDETLTLEVRLERETVWLTQA